MSIELDYAEFELLCYLADPRIVTQKHVPEGLPILSVAIESLLIKKFIKKKNATWAVTKTGLEVLEPYRVKRAVLLAAGIGERMLPLTKNTPKPLAKIGNKRIIETILDALISANITEIYIVRGHLKDKFDILLSKYPFIKFIDNPHYHDYNNIYSAYLAREYFANAYVIESDLVIKDPLIIRPYEFTSNYCGAFVDHTTDWYFQTSKSGRIIDLLHGKADNVYQYIGISYWSQKNAQTLQNTSRQLITKHNDFFLEDLVFSRQKGSFNFNLRKIGVQSAIELDTYQELQNYRKTLPKT